MTTAEFWQIVDEVHAESGGAMDKKCELLTARLNDITAEELGDFRNHFAEADAAAYSWELWGAAYVIHGGCSDDSFSDFRACLISHGSKVYRAALTDPESLADLDVEDEEVLFYEGFQYVASVVAEKRFGEFLKVAVSLPNSPRGTEWNEDTVEVAYPRLAAKYSAKAVDTGGEPRSKRPWWRFW